MDYDGGPARGRHTIFLGYAVGVGKTYAMLAAARGRASRGEDVVIGYLEPHVRPGTRALADGIETLPPMTIQYHGAHFTELDTAGVLARRPALALVDELAHSNTPGPDHDTRWESVAELLDAGIDVFSTVNVQHFESVAPLVSRIMGVSVRETLPDAVLIDAVVQLVDVEPDVLIDRAKRGVVYPADSIGAALSHALRRSTLVSLRQIAHDIVRDHQQEVR